MAEAAGIISSVFTVRISIHKQRAQKPQGKGCDPFSLPPHESPCSFPLLPLLPRALKKICVHLFQSRSRRLAGQGCVKLENVKSTE